MSITRTLPIQPPFPKLCSCGMVFTEEWPIYCRDCSTFTHTVYWLRGKRP